MKRTIPLLITAIVGTVLVVAYFIPHPPFDSLREDFSIFFDIIASVAFILGGAGLLSALAFYLLIRIGGLKLLGRVIDPMWALTDLVLGREVLLVADVEDADAFEGWGLDGLNQTRQVERLSRGPGLFQDIGQEDVLAAGDGIGRDTHERQQAGG